AGAPDAEETRREINERAAALAADDRDPRCSPFQLQIEIVFVMSLADRVGAFIDRGAPFTARVASFTPRVALSCARAQSAHASQRSHDCISVGGQIGPQALRPQSRGRHL